MQQDTVLPFGRPSVISLNWYKKVGFNLSEAAWM